jgi:hypothetical protein
LQQSATSTNFWGVHQIENPAFASSRSTPQSEFAFLAPTAPQNANFLRPAVSLLRHRLIKIKGRPGDSSNLQQVTQKILFHHTVHHFDLDYILVFRAGIAELPLMRVHNEEFDMAPVNSQE